MIITTYSIAVRIITINIFITAYIILAFTDDIRYRRIFMPFFGNATAVCEVIFLKNNSSATESAEISGSPNEEAARLRELFGGSCDLTLKNMSVRTHQGERSVLVASMEGLCDKELMTVSVINRIAEYVPTQHESDVYTQLFRSMITCCDVKTVTTLGEAARLIMSGFALVFVSGSRKAAAVGVQGYAFRGIDEPQTEVLQRGSREGFTEPIKLNQALIRRRLKTGALVFEPMQVGMTDVCLCYLRDTAPQQLVELARQRLQSAGLEAVYTAGCLVEYLEDGGSSLFNGVGVTERPDTACAKLCEGKIAVICDGTPSVLIVPHLMTENFSTLDDYSDRPYFATMTRWLKYAAFLISVTLPGLYVALASYSPEFFPSQLLTRVTTSISKTPFSAFSEVLLFTFIYEIMREAGLRLPKTLGHAVSIIGGLVIGDTAVSSGFIGAPTLMIVALTVICSYVIPDLYAPIAALRFLFILFGGMWGIWGIVLMFCAMIADLCAKESFGVPFMLPVAPAEPSGFRDVLVRAPWRVLARRKFVAGGEA